MELQRSMMDVMGLRVHSLQRGEGPSTVILLHGGGIDCAGLSWGLLLPEMPSAWCAIAFDWPGYGESDRLDTACTVEFLVGFLAAFMDAMGIEKASLAGISMGGAAALGFSLRFPERVEKLVLVDSYGLQRKAPFHILSCLFVKTPGINQWAWGSMRSPAMLRWFLQALLRRPGAVTEELVQAAAQEVRRPGSGQAFITFQVDEMQWAGLRTCYMDRLGEIQAPTLIVHGTHDSSVPPGCAREAHERISGSKLHWMEGCGHWPQRDNPGEFNRVVKAFLED